MNNLNIAIVGKNPMPHLLEMEDCDFRKNFPYANPQADYILHTSDHMTPREFLKFLLLNRIGVVWVSNDFSFDCSAEHYEADVFKAAVEKIFHILWECPNTAPTPKRKRK